MSGRWAWMAAAAALLAGPGAAQEVKGKPADKPVAAPAPGEMPKPAPEMAQLSLFEGSWTCEGMAPPGPFGPGGKMSGTVKVHKDLGGFWQSGVVKSTMAGMPPLEGMFHTTFDPAAKRYVMLWVDNMGGWAQSTASGWEGDTMTFAGDTYMGGQKLGSRDTFTRMPGGGFKHTMELQVDGQWTAMGEETCRKAAAK